MANYHKRNSIRAVQWDPENAQSFEGIKKLIAENQEALLSESLMALSLQTVFHSKSCSY